MKNITARVSIIALTVFLAACSNEDATPSVKKPTDAKTKGLTEFALVSRPAADKTNSKRLRSTAIYNGAGLDFYWTEGDKVWVNVSSTLHQSTSDNISIQIDNTGKTATTKFYFSGAYTAQSYPIRYTGSGNTAPDKVTIRSEQAQATPNDGAHIGKDGDCGTATAQRAAEGYEFLLAHKASYITFLPYYDRDEDFKPSVKVTQIKVSADEAVAGVYDFSDDGLAASPTASASHAITLALGGKSGFAIPNAPTIAANAGIMVIAPGTYHNFTVEYTLYDSETKVRARVSKNYGEVTCVAGENKRIAHNLGVIYYCNNHYMWDSVYPYWTGFDRFRPYADQRSNGNYPTSGKRYFNTTAGWVKATHSCRNLPTVNALCWYVWDGDPHWDGELAWSTFGHLYKGGMWFKNSNTIQGFSQATTKWGDYRTKFVNTTLEATTDPTLFPEGSANWWVTPSQGRPQNVANYFFLPAMGFVADGLYDLDYTGYAGAYWSCNAAVRDNGFAACLHFDKNRVGVEMDTRKWGYVVAANLFR